MTSAHALRFVPLFSQLREDDLMQLGRLLKSRAFPKNRVILFAHDPCDAFYVVMKGTVKSMLVAEDGREVVLSILGQGDFFGEMALMDDEPYASSAIAMEDTELLVLHREEFRRCITEMPEMAFGLLRALCTRLRIADDKIGGLMLLDVSGRLSHVLLDLAARNGGEHIADPPTHQVLAQMVGSSRETVSRTMAGLVSQNLIATNPDGIRIVNRRGLESSVGQLLRRRVKTPLPGAERRRSGSSPTPS